MGTVIQGGFYCSFFVPAFNTDFKRGFNNNQIEKIAKKFPVFFYLYTNKALILLTGKNDHKQLEQWREITNCIEDDPDFLKPQIMTYIELAYKALSKGDYKKLRQNTEDIQRTLYELLDQPFLIIGIKAQADKRKGGKADKRPKAIIESIRQKLLKNPKATAKELFDLFPDEDKPEDITVNNKNYEVYFGEEFSIIQKDDQTGKDRKIGFERFQKYVSAIRKKL